MSNAAPDQDLCAVGATSPHLPIPPATQQAIARLDAFQATIEAKLHEFELSIRMPTPVSASARRSIRQLLPWIVNTAIVASSTTIALTHLIR